MSYQVKKFDQLVGLAGFSEALLRNHFTLYEGYVNNTNKLMELLMTKEQGTPEYAELKRRFGWEFNGMRLHEYYFENLSVNPATLDQISVLSQMITENFGSTEAWEKDFRAIGAMRGIGWAVLYRDVVGKKLINTWIGEHDGGHLAGSVPILVMDVFEHAYMLDYQLKKADYIEAFVKAIDWKVVEQRFVSSMQ